MDNKTAIKLTDAARAEALAWFHKHLKPGDTVYTILDHVSKSGMSRDIRLVIITQGDDGKPRLLHPNYHAANLLSYPRATKGDGLRVQGCGQDMGFHIVYALGAAMWPDGTPEPHSRRNGAPDSAGGYALKHSWL